MNRLAVLDTNVIVSAGIRRSGAPAMMLMDWVLEGQVQAVVCPAVVAEYREVMARAKFRRHGFPPIWLDVLLQEAMLLPDPQPWPLPLPDADGAIFLALASVAGATLVTGNLADFPEAQRAGVDVCAPAEYLRCLTATAGKAAPYS